MISLTHKTTATPDFGAWHFYVEHGKLLDLCSFAVCRNLDVAQIDLDSVYAVCGAYSKLRPGEWLEIDFEGQ